MDELNRLDTPKGVDEKIFSQLKDEFARQLSALSSNRAASKPPLGSVNAVPDLALTDLGGGIYELGWHYYNIGDYNQDGIVGVADITPLAVHFGESYQADEGNSLLAVVDGSGNLVVDIADITPIAVNIGAEVAAYSVEVSPEKDAGYTSSDTLDISRGLDAATQRMRFTTNITPDPGEWYRVVPLDSSQAQGIGSNEVQAAVLGHSPLMPSELEAKVIGPYQIDISWRDNSDNEDGFSLERKRGLTGTWAVVGGGTTNVTSFSDDALDPITTYYYRIRAVNSYGYSAYSPWVIATTQNAIPFTPTSFTATPVSWMQIDLAWVDISNNEDGFKLQRKTGESGSWQAIAETAADVETFSDAGLDPQTEYYYRLCAFNHLGDSALTDEVIATTLDHPPAAPASLTAQQISSAQLDLEWQDNAHNEDGFSIERRLGAGAWNVVGVAEAQAVIYYDYTLAANTLYDYRIRAYNSSGFSAYSNIASATTCTAAKSWAHTFGGNLGEQNEVFVTDSDGYIYVAGYYGYHIDHVDCYGHCDFMFFVYAPDGTLVKAKRLNYGASSCIRDMAIDDNGVLYLVGNRLTGDISGSDALFLQFGKDGGMMTQKLWSMREEEWCGDVARCIALSPDGSEYIGGEVSAGNTDGIFILKYSPLGTLDWQLLYSIPLFGDLTDMAVSEDGSVYAVGRFYTKIFEEGAFALQISPDGEIIWQQAWPTEISSSPAIEIDAEGNLIIAGLGSASGDRRGLMMKLSPSGLLLNSFSTPSAYWSDLSLCDDGSLIATSGTLVMKLSNDWEFVWGERWQADPFYAYATRVDISGDGIVLIGTAGNPSGHFIKAPLTQVTHEDPGLYPLTNTAEFITGVESGIDGLEVPIEGSFDNPDGFYDCFILRADPTNW